MNADIPQTDVAGASIGAVEAAGSRSLGAIGSGEGTAPAGTVTAAQASAGSDFQTKTIVQTKSIVPLAQPADAIAEAPAAVWYVRPATGGQFGPASGEIMRAWIDEGRVGASSLVWRAGWPEWRSAAAIFPKLGVLLATPGVIYPGAQATLADASSAAVNNNGPQPPSAASLPMGQVVQSLPADLSVAGLTPGPSAAVPPLVPSLRKRRRNNDLSLIASIVLILISIILVIVLILVFRRQNEPAEKTTPTTQSRAPSAHDLQMASRRQ